MALHSRYDLSTRGEAAREDLTDIIYNISPTEVPTQNLFGRESVSNTKHEWQTDSLQTPDTSNAHVDGADFSSITLQNSQRLWNYCQISRKDLLVSRRADRVNKAGRSSELAYQIAKSAQELRRDIEAIATGNQAAVLGDDSSTAMLVGSMNAWLTTNTDRGATGTDPALSDTTHGGPTTAAGDGTVRALTQAGFLALVEAGYTGGGYMSVAMMTAPVKQIFSAYYAGGGTGAVSATPYQDHGARARSERVGGIVSKGAVGMYETDFGVIDMVPNRFSRNRDFWLLDPTYWAYGYLDGYQVKEIARTGDAQKRMLLTDWTLVSRNEAASGIYADVDHTAAMTA